MTCRIYVNSVGYGAAAMTQSLLETLQDPASAALFFTTVALSFGVFYFFFGRDTRSPLKDMPPPPTPRNYTLQQIKVRSKADHELCPQYFLKMLYKPMCLL